MNKLEQAAREVIRQHSMECLSDKTVDALRKALAEQEKPLYRKVLREMLDAHEQAEPSQLADATLEPVAWKDLTYGNLHHQDFGNSIPLYAAPVRTKDLTDDEIESFVSEHRMADYIYRSQAIAMCRAVIAADREKNCAG